MKTIHEIKRECRNTGTRGSWQGSQVDRAIKIYALQIIKEIEENPSRYVENYKGILVSREDTFNKLKQQINEQ